MERLRNMLYVVLLAGFGGAALVHLALSALATAMAAAGVATPAWLGFGIPVPILQDFDDPPRRMIELLAPSPRYDAGDAGGGLLARYDSWHAPVLVLLAVAVLAVRRVRGWMRSRALAAPASFSGFIFGLGLVGMAVMLMGEIGGWRLFHPIEPIAAGAILGFVAFVAAELLSLRTAPAVPGAPAAEAGQFSRARRPPVWTVLAVALPFAIAGGGWALASSLGPGSLAPLAIALVAIAAGLAVGAVATVIALVRRERWIPLQVVAFLLNFGVGLLLMATWGGR